MRGVSASLTSVELKSANDLNNIFPCPHFGGEHPKTKSPKLIHGWPTGYETDSDSWKSPLDLEEWDKPEHGNWSCCPNLPLEEGLTWEEIMREPPHRQDRHLLLECDNQDSDWDTDGVTDALPEESSRGASKQSSPKKEQPEKTLMETLTETQHNETLTETAMGPLSQDVIQLHVGDDDLE